MALGISQGFSVGSGSSVALASANQARGYLLIQNQSTINPVYVCFGSNNAATVAAGIQIPPGGNLELGPWVLRIAQTMSPKGNIPPTDVAAITAGGSVTVTVLEY